MGESTVKKTLLIGLTFLGAMMLIVLPLPRWIIWFRPEWVFMVLIFWMIAVPDRIGIGIAWMIGLLLLLVAAGIILGLFIDYEVHPVYFALWIAGFPGWFLLKNLPLPGNLATPIQLIVSIILYFLVGGAVWCAIQILRRQTSA